ncbi:hypothetical protein [Nocardiopsis composta]|uniref:Uncharacterized protein n=1 Tax=Nocardiopsis composta TaxID=157465 RepID=A0A7W8QM90_9ACTN|nr:hypothetical protein [Nocardiopsis composta]MBB5432916.1 hypothetical protein [Nocardiopsis composta]
MLRHVLGLLAGLALAPGAWFGAGWAAVAVAEHTGSAGGVDASAASVPLGVLMAIGVAGGFVAGARISPLAPLGAGVPLLGYGVWPLVAPASIPSWLPEGSLVHPAGPALPAGLLLGTLFFIAAMAPSRWHRRAAAPAASPPPVPPAVPAPAAEPAPGPAPAPEPLPGDPEKTTTPFQRDPRGSGWQSLSAEREASRTQEFRR